MKPVLIVYGVCALIIWYILLVIELPERMKEMYKSCVFKLKVWLNEPIYKLVDEDDVGVYYSRGKVYRVYIESAFFMAVVFFIIYLLLFT